MSLRARLLVATAVIALVALLGADFATYAELRSYLYGQVDTALQLSHKSVEASITELGTTQGNGAPAPGAGGTTAGGPRRLPGNCKTLDGEAVDTQGLDPGTFLEVRSKAGGVLYSCALTEFGSAQHNVPRLPGTISGFSPARGEHHEPTTYFTAPGATAGTTFRVRASIISAGKYSGGLLVVAVPLTGTDNTLHDLIALELVVSGAALLLALVLGWWLVRASLRPLRDMERTAEAIADGQLTERVPGDNEHTEVGRVARALNVMLGRIESAFAERDRTEHELRESEERMRQFVADASHELRTPTAAVRAYAELFDRGAAERPRDLERLMRGIQSESARMGHLVENLLLLAHLDEGRALQIEPVDLVEVAADAVATAQALGPAWPARLVADGPVVVRGDSLRLRQVVDNLLGNVRVHTPEGTTATVTVRDDGDMGEVAVADDGPGLSAADAEHIWERFFRADPSRSRHRGGAGLGLAIVASIVDAHGGTVTLSRPPEGGLRFVVRIPKRGPRGDGAGGG